MYHQRPSATKLPEGRYQGKSLAAGHCRLLCIAGTGKWRRRECFRSQKQTATNPSDGGFQGEAAGHWVLVVTLQCRSQALENLGGPCCWRKLCMLQGPAQWAQQSREAEPFSFLQCLQCPLLAKLQCQLAMEKYLNGPDPFSQSWHSEFEAKRNNQLSGTVHPFDYPAYMCTPLHIFEFLYNKTILFLPMYGYPSLKEEVTVLSPNWDTQSPGSLYPLLPILLFPQI